MIDDNQFLIILFVHNIHNIVQAFNISAGQFT